MSKKISLFLVALCLLATSILPAFAANNIPNRQEDTRQQIFASVLSLSSSELTKYAKDGIWGRKLIDASIIAKLSGKKIDQIIDQIKEDKTIAQLFDENKLSLVQFETEKKTIRNAMRTVAQKQRTQHLAKTLNLSEKEVNNYLQDRFNPHQLIDAKIIADLSQKKLSTIISAMKAGKTTSQLLEENKISDIAFREKRCTFDPQDGRNFYHNSHYQSRHFYQ